MPDIHSSCKEEKGVALYDLEGKGEETRNWLFQHILSAGLCGRKYQKTSLIQSSKSKLQTQNIGKLKTGDWGRRKETLASHFLTRLQYFVFSTTCVLCNYICNQMWLTLSPILPWGNQNSILAFFFLSQGHTVRNLMALVLFFENNTVFDKGVWGERGEKAKKFIVGTPVFSLTQNLGCPTRKTRRE